MDVLLLGPPLAALSLGFAWYLSLVARRNKARAALSSIDMQLRSRHEVLPGVMALARHFLAHEGDLLRRLTALRVRAAADYRHDDPDELRQHLAAENALGATAQSLFTLAADYPMLRSNAAIIAARERFRAAETNLAAARPRYNAAVGALNRTCEGFPGKLLAALARVRPMPLFETTGAAGQPLGASESG